MSVDDLLLAVDDFRGRAVNDRLLRDYYDGNHRLSISTEAFLEKYGDIVGDLNLNVCPKIVRNFSDRTRIQAWLGNGAEAAEALESQLPIVRTIQRSAREAYRMGDGFILAWPGRDGTMRPWYHRAEQIVFESDDQDPETFRWVGKFWTTRAGYGRVNLYYEDTLERYETREVIRTVNMDGDAEWPTRASEYQQVTDDEDGPTIENPSPGEVPWVHVSHEADEDGGRGTSVLRDVIPVQDMLNATLSYIAVNGEQYAAPLRYLLNYMPETYIDERTGEVTKEVLRYDEVRQRIFGIEGEGPFGQLTPPDPRPLLDIVESFGSWAARIAGVPPSEITPDLGNVPSGAAMRMLANERTARIRDFTADNTPQISRLMSLLGIEDAQPVWEDPAPSDERERHLLAQSRAEIGWPLDENLREQGYDPDDVERIARKAEAKEANLGQAAADAYRRGVSPSELLSHDFGLDDEGGGDDSSTEDRFGDR